MRIDRYLTNSGIGSRSEVKILIKKRQVRINDQIVKSGSLIIDENNTNVFVDDKLIKYHEFYYVLLNKPKGYVCAVEDNIHSTVIDLVEEFKFANIFPVGRLDIDTTGTLLLTNDGDLAHKLLSPKYHVDKTYFVETDKEIKKELVDAFRDGIILDEELTLPANLIILEDNKAELTIHQGKFHQVKRMFKHFGLEVINLDRKSFAFLNHEKLQLGEYRELNAEEVSSLKNLIKK